MCRLLVRRGKLHQETRAGGDASPNTGRWYRVLGRYWIVPLTFGYSEFAQD